MSVFKTKATSAGNGKDFEVPSAGSHTGILVALVDLGTHIGEYKGVENKARKIFLVWELTAEKKADGSNFVVGRDYTLSLNEKASLRKIIEQYRGRAFQEDEEFDFGKMLGKPFQLTLLSMTSRGGNAYAKIDSVGPVPKGLKPEPAKLKPFQWEIGNDIDDLPDWLPYVYGIPVDMKIKESEEFKSGDDTSGNANEVNNDDLAEVF